MNQFSSSATPAAETTGDKDSRASGTGNPDSAQRLRMAAGPIFAEKGFALATVREIASAAGANVAAVGYHFGDKMGLYRDVILGILDNCEHQFPVSSSSEDPAKALHAVVRALLARMLAENRNGWEHHLMMREMLDPTPVLSDIVNSYFRPVFDRLQQIMVANHELARQRVGGKDSDSQTLDEVSARRLVLSVVGQCLYYRVSAGVLQVLFTDQQRAQVVDIDELARHVTRVALAGVESYAGGDGDLIESWEVPE